MKLTAFAIKQISELVKDIMSGSKWVDFFNSYGARNVYDNALPDIGKPNHVHPSKKEYIAKRLSDINGSLRLQQALLRLATLSEFYPDAINDIITPEKYKIEKANDDFVMMGDVVNNQKDIETEAHFQNIQNQIIAELDKARVSITIAMAWFTNKVLADKLIEKHKEGLDVRITIYDDNTNRKHGVELAGIEVKMVKAQRGGKMHDKFCVIDNQVVITGSYNWSDNAEFRNDENIAIIRDNNRASDFSVEFRRLTNICVEQESCPIS